MIEYLVVFRVSTALMSLEELSNELGQPNSHSHTIGSTDDESYDRTVWEIESLEERDVVLDEHLESIVDQFPLVKLKGTSLPQDQEKSLAIAAFFDDATCSVYISSHWINLLNQYDIDLEVSCYPSNFGDRGSE